MGILISGILGPMKNKTGAVIGRMHRGQNVITQLYIRKHPNKKRSEAQLATELSFGLLNNFLSNIQGLVDTGFRKKVKHNSPVNAAYSYNFKHAFLDVNGKIVLDYPNLVYSLGYIEGPESPALITEDGSLFLSWEDMPQSEYCSYSDMATVLVYDPLEKGDLIFENVCLRSDLSVQLDISPFLGKNVHCYMSFCSANEKNRGDSVYLGQNSVSIPILTESA
jgi:hypothetical protein